MNLRLPLDVDILINMIYKEGYEAYAVGGCIRDSILGRTPNDWDICTSVKPDFLTKLLEYKGIKVIPTGLKHGTITILLNEEEYEITTYRIEGEYENNRRPKHVKFTQDIVQDLSRRDFTINSMAYNDKNGLVDPFGGRFDLKDKLVRTVGNPNKRFDEDALRILRGIRFATQLEFVIESNTLKSMELNRHLLSSISAERIREELNKIILSRTPSKGFRLLKDTKIFKYIIPEMQETFDFDQKNPHHHKDVFNHTMDVLDNTEEDLILRLAALLHDIGKPSTFSVDTDGIGHFYGHHMESMKIAQNILKRLKYDNETIERVSILIKEHMTKQDLVTDKAIKRFINRVGEKDLGRLFKLQKSDITGSNPPYDFTSIDNIEKKCKEILDREDPLTVRDLRINGYDLIDLGIKPGEKMGIILDSLLEIVLEYPEKNNKETLLRIVKDDLT
ncbi:CCA tRNA nucleotidyltransferase [Sporosalibacterium faouarense]|uniref:CCA tRNA nucleotidyltransferase n=1 Tax=Sporosalibacterium faouarense TaxID=516123 RepID=UPI001A9C73AA|nr:HD domain-containing protein [Sporosalibacterium faouarense]